jgi:hypothetical protein
MKTFGSSVERKCYTFISLATKEKLQMRMKAQGHSRTTKQERAHRVLMPRTSKSATSTKMDVDHRKIGRKILDLRG